MSYDYNLYIPPVRNLLQLITNLHSLWHNYLIIENKLLYKADYDSFRKSNKSR